MNVELIGRLYAFVVTLADHYDAPGPSPTKTAQHYQLAERARQLRAEVLTEGFTGLPAAPHRPETHSVELDQGAV
ncbi:hypothetical protein [Pseudomonas monteilii]|uniref:hypothetical protein n=1 Tax=Pseudomonas monteilii TaxID=76759 RepID=UPI001FD60918|nr:hypothetical protein [Pseudomonas monteilii]MCJ7854601.1 hypothetical protein [Pseudomonas monteilii]